MASQQRQENAGVALGSEGQSIEPRPWEFHVPCGGGDVALHVRLIRDGDITKWRGDAIVTAANEQLAGGGGVDGAIHNAAGPSLLTACMGIQPEGRSSTRCPTGTAVLTRGPFSSRLGAKDVIHVVGPTGRNPQRRSLLAGAYAGALEISVREGYETIAFPAVSTGIYGYPKPEAAEVAASAIVAAAARGSDGIGKLRRLDLCVFDDENFGALSDALPRAIASAGLA